MTLGTSMTWGHSVIKFITPDSLPQSIKVLGSGNYLCLTPALHGCCCTYPVVCKSLLAQFYRVSYCNLAWKCSPVAPHPDVDLEKTTSCSTVLSWVSSCFCRYNSPCTRAVSYCLCCHSSNTESMALYPAHFPLDRRKVLVVLLPIVRTSWEHPYSAMSACSYPE